MKNGSPRKAFPAPQTDRNFFAAHGYLEKQTRNERAARLIAKRKERTNKPE